MEIKTIAKEVNDILIVEKSKFIAYLFQCDSKKQIDDIIDKMHKKYEDATHVCYAYIVNDNDTILYKANDDGEPSQTAGAPILNVLKKNNLMNVLCVVVRYFGGIKLGAGGLTRTYTNSAALVVNQAEIVTLVDVYKDEFIFSYDRIKEIDKIFDVNKIEIIEKKYDENVHYIVLTNKEDEAIELYNKIKYLNISITRYGTISTRKNGDYIK